MAITPQRRLYDGFLALPNAINSGVAANLLPNTQCAFAVNATFREDYPETRPAFKKLEITGDIATEFESLNFQDGIVYTPPNQSSQLCAIAGGNLYSFTIDGDVFEITKQNNSDTQLNADNIRCWTVQAGQYLVAQDGINLPIIFDGLLTRKADPATEVPVGTSMAYGLRRLVVSNERAYVIGNLEGNPAQGGAAAVLKFTDPLGGAFVVDSNITAMTFNAVPDTSLGQGNLLIFTKDKTYTTGNLYDVRENWQQVLSLINSGSEGAYTLTQVNSDTWYRAFDGIRSFAISRRNQNTWTNTALSKEVNRILEAETQRLLYLGSMVTFNGRLLSTAYPQVIGGRWFSEGIISLDFEPVSGISEKSAPNWEGLWTGLHPQKIVRGIFNGTERCFVFNWNKDKSQNEIYEILQDSDEEYLDNGITRICSFIESKKFEFQSPFQTKELLLGELFMDRLKGRTTFDIKFRQDDSPCWTDWRSWCEYAETNNCRKTEEGCLDVREFKPQWRSRRRIGKPIDVCDPTTGSLTNQGYTFQTRIAWKGRARVKSFRMSTVARDQDINGDCDLKPVPEGESVC